MWGAKSGKEQLPPFPEPTFAAGFACGVPRAATECVVGFQSVEAFDKAHQMVCVLSPVSWCSTTTASSGVCIECRNVQKSVYAVLHDVQDAARPLSLSPVKTHCSLAHVCTTLKECNRP